MSTNDIITTDLQSQELDAVVELYELKLNDTTTLFFHSGNDQSLNSVKFHPLNQPLKNNATEANEYIELPLLLSGIERNADGASNRPVVTIANVGSVFKGLLNDESFSFQDLVGTRFTRRTTLAKYLVGGADDSTPFEFPVAAYIVDRISGENALAVEIELTMPFDVEGIKLPNRSVIGKYCVWNYQGASNLGQGGCTWPANNTLEDESDFSYFVTFDIEDRPLVASSLFDAADVTYTGNHSQDDYVVYDNKKWRSEVDSNNQTPSAASSFWTQVFTWVDWSSGSSYSVGDYVRYENKIWKALKASQNKAPSDSLVYWQRQDYCSKKLSGCKCRFQFVATAGDLPSARKETDKTLPFGGYPASVKFK